jgi:broad specificity phosphatase PhoE
MAAQNCQHPPTSTAAIGTNRQRLTARRTISSVGKAWLITHPETKLDQAGKVHGNLDPPLSYSGTYNAKQIAKRFTSKDVKAIHSSPKVRARQMAQFLSKVTGAPVSVHNELIPWDLSRMSGAKTASIRPLLEFFSNHPNRVVPGGESKAAVLARYKKFMQTVKPGDVIVGHSQHSLALDAVRKGGNLAKVPMFGGKAGSVQEIEV